MLDTLRALSHDEETLVVFSSDNGPWSLFAEQGGSAGPLRGAKGATFEGGMRVPTIFRWPGHVVRAVVADMGATMDLLPTLCALAGAPAPRDRILDGVDLSGVLLRSEPSPRQDVFYYRGPKVYALRHGPYKAHFSPSRNTAPIRKSPTIRPCCSIWTRTPARASTWPRAIPTSSPPSAGSRPSTRAPWCRSRTSSQSAQALSVLTQRDFFSTRNLPH